MGHDICSLAAAFYLYFTTSVIELSHSGHSYMRRS